MAGNGSRNAVYFWPTLRGFYAAKVIPGCLKIRGKPTDTAEEVLARLPADVRGFLFHIVLTETGNFPSGRARLVEALEARGVRVWNARVTDISKRRVHAINTQAGLPCVLAPREGEDAEPLIVKTDRNYGGRAERGLTARQRRVLGLGDGSSLIRDPFDYKVLPRGKVPAAWWSDPDLVIERFITNPEQRHYRVALALNRCAFISGHCPRPIKKMDLSSDLRQDLLRRGEMHPALPPALLRTAYAFAEAFALDFGAVDLAADETGRFFVIDVASTPWLGRRPSPLEKSRAAFLREAWEEAR